MKSKITEKTTIPELTAIVYDHLTKNGISALLVGGSAVSIYTDNKYESEDLDFISPHDHQEILEVMSKIDFTPQPTGNKNLSHPHCSITVEFPARTAIIGSTPEKVTHEVEINNVKVRMLSPSYQVWVRVAHKLF